MSTTETFIPSDNVQRAKRPKTSTGVCRINTRNNAFEWSTQMERVELIRNKLPGEVLEVVAQEAGIPVGQLLGLFGIPQTTYNKKKRAQELLSSRDSEMALILKELLVFGKSVFNHEHDKFQRWLTKPNNALGGVTPVSLFDSVTGMEQVKNALLRLEHGNLA